MRNNCAATILLALVILAACTTKPKTETAKDKDKQQALAPLIADPTPPAPPNSVEVSADLNHMPTFLFMAIGGIGSEGEKEGIDVQENMRLFRTDATAQEIVSFYARAMKDRGWTTDNQVARSDKVGLTIQEYRRANEALYLIVSEPEEPGPSDATKGERHVALLPAKVNKVKP